MKVIVFGGTGPTGKAVLQKSVQDPGTHVICKLFNHLFVIFSFD